MGTLSLQPKAASLKLLLRAPKKQVYPYFSITGDIELELLQAISNHAAELAEDLQWYKLWLERCLAAAHLPLQRSLGSTSATSEEAARLFLGLWKHIAAASQKEGNVSIDSMVTSADIAGIFKPDAETPDKRRIIFAILEWQTMLWKIEPGVCIRDELAIRDEMDGYKGQATVNLRQDSDSCRRPLPHMLMGFGTLLPSANYWAYGVDQEKKEALRSISTVSPKTLNAYLLMSIESCAKIVWIDTLSHHLEFDDKKRTLYLFRFPSFCLANQDESNSCTIYGCGEPLGQQGNRFWADKLEIVQLLRETLLTYRLLFGQSKRSRHLYRELQPFARTEGFTDQMLNQVCGRKRCDLTAQVERDVYDLACDFPMYKNRLILLNDALSGTVPSTWKQLWNDKRNSAQWGTFWLVLILGGVGVLLQTIQVVLQVVELALSIG